MRTLYTKFIFYTVGIMVLSFMITFVIINTFYHQQLKSKNDEKNVTIAKNITSYIERNNDASLNDYLNTIANSGYKIFVAQENGDTQFYGEPFRKENLSDSAIKDVLNGSVYHGMRTLPKETFVTGIFSDELANTVGVPFTYEDTTYALFLRPNIKLLFTEVHYLLSGLFVGMGIISLIAMLIIAKMLITPITKLTEATKKVSQEQFLVDLPISRNDEIGELAHSFQQMTVRLKETDQLRKEFISNVSHDFQTPLLNIKGYTNLLKSDNITGKERNNYLNVIQQEGERLSSLTKQLLLLTSLDQLSTIVNKEHFSLKDMIKDIIYKYHWLLHEKNISLTIEAEDITFYGDPSLLENVFDNLVSNALKYTNNFGTINIIIKEDKHNTIFSIEDSGIGINDVHIPHLFERFFRVDESRNEDVEGTGLGLSIVEQIVTLHDGQIKVNSIKNEGSTFTLYFPKL